MKWTDSIDRPSYESFQSKIPEIPPRDNDAVANQRINNTLDIDYLSDLSLSLFESIGEGKDIPLSLARLVLELEDQIPNYDTIISDDVSGRLASLFLRQVINNKKTQLGRKAVKTYFISGGHHYNKEVYKNIEDFIVGKKASVNKALLVTEYIETGNSINSIVEILQRQNISFDVASVSVSNFIFQPGNQAKLKNLLQRLKYGTVSEAGLVFHYHKHSFAGVAKDKEKGSVHPVRTFSPYFSQETLAKTREIMSLMAEEISKLILK